MQELLLHIKEMLERGMTQECHERHLQKRKL